MELQTNRLFIRPFTQADAADVYAYCSQEGIGVNAGWAAHTTLAESAAILRGWIADGCKHAIVWRETGRVIGHIAVDEDSEEGRADTKEIGCALNADYHRRGIMTEAMRAVLAFLFETGTIEYVWACCFQSNLASKGMIEKCGFRFMQEGTFYAESLQREFSSYEYRMSRREWQALVEKKQGSMS